MKKIYFTGDPLYFEQGKEMEGEIKKLMQIGSVVKENHGFLLMHRTYGGNINRRKIFSDLMKGIFSGDTLVSLRMEEWWILEG